MDIDFGVVICWAVIGAGFACLVMVVSSGIASQEMLAATVKDATVWLRAPAAIGAAMGAAYGFLRA